MSTLSRLLSGSTRRPLAWFLAALLCQAAPAMAASDSARSCIESIRLFAQGQLSAHSIQERLGSEWQVRREGAYCLVGAERRQEEYVLRCAGPDDITDHAIFRFARESGVTLADFEDALGSWQLVFASKTSSVRFQLVGTGERRVSAFIDLYTSTPFSGSPVSSVTLRVDHDKPVESQGAAPTPFPRSNTPVR
jgi:hypothetical protein